MNTKLVKQFLDACHQAKKITELMPQLPDGIKPRHIHVIDMIYELGEKREYVKVSDVSEALKVTRPSITQLIKELEDKNVVLKQQGSNDSRIITLTLTELGIKYYETYVDKYQNQLCRWYEGISEDEMKITIQTISKIHHIMKAQG